MMKVGRILVLMIMCTALAGSAAAPAFAWYWPIFGFGPGAGAPAANGPLPSSILPGTIEWASQPECSAQLVLPGYTYGLDAFSGDIAVGPAPLYNGPIIALPGISGNSLPGITKGINIK